MHKDFSAANSSWHIHSKTSDAGVAKHVFLELVLGAM
jgi:hypothetical protein